jgi:hypothetical protein
MNDTMAASRRTRAMQGPSDWSASPTRRLRAHAETLPELEAVKKRRSTMKLPASTQEVQRARKPLAVESVGDAAVRMAGRIPLAEVPQPGRPRPARALRALTHLERAVLLSADGTATVRAIIAAVDEPAERVFAALIRLERLGLLGF